MRARRLAASAPASTKAALMSATPEAARIASASLAVSASIVASASRTRIAATEGKSRAAAFISAFSAAAPSAGGSAAVNRPVKGAPLNVLGEKTKTKLIAKLRQSTRRRLATRAVTSRPSTLSVTRSPIFTPSPSATPASIDTSGGPP